MGLEEFVDLVEHLFDALADEVALLIEGGELGLDVGLGLIVRAELGAESGYLGLQGRVLRVGRGAGFAFAFDDLYCLEDFLFEGLEFIDADATGKGCCTHIYFQV